MTLRKRSPSVVIEVTLISARAFELPLLTQSSRKEAVVDVCAALLAPVGPIEDQGLDTLEPSVPGTPNTGPGCFGGFWAPPEFTSTGVDGEPLGACVGD